MPLLSDTEALHDAVEFIRRAEKVALVAHLSPDPDAIGALLGLGHTIRLLGKQVVLLCDDPVPREVVFLPGSALVQTVSPDGFIPDVLVGVDASDAERLGQAWTQLAAFQPLTMSIDHHITNLRFGAVNLVNPAWASTAEGVLVLVDALGVALTPDIADCLLAGIVGDTRNFSTASTTPGSLEAAARLVSAGANIARVSEMIFNRRTVTLLRHWGVGLSNLHFVDGLIWTAISLPERQRIGASAANGSGLSNLLISAEEANIAAVFTEQEDGTVDMSLRARPGFDVAKVALTLGGGGHTLAAGATVAGALDEVIESAIPLLKQAAYHRVGED